MRHVLMMLSACSLLVVIDNEARRIFVRLLREAIRKANKTELQHCQDVGVKQSHWSSACAAQGPFNGEALIRTDQETWRWFSLLYLLAYGLPKEVRTAEPIVRRMAKMDLELTSVEREETA